MFNIVELPTEEVKELEQFTPLELKTETTETTENIETVSKQDYDSLVKAVEELKNLINKE